MNFRGRFNEILIIAMIVMSLAVLPGELDRLWASHVTEPNCRQLKEGEHQVTLVRADGETRLRCREKS